MFSLCGLCGELLDQKAIDNLKDAKTNISEDEKLQYHKFKRLTERIKAEGINF